MAKKASKTATDKYRGGADQSMLLKLAERMALGEEKPKSVLRDLGVASAADMRRLTKKWEAQGKALMKELERLPEQMAASARNAPAAKTGRSSQTKPKSEGSSMPKSNGGGARWPRAMSANAAVVAEIAERDEARSQGRRAMALNAPSPVKFGMPLGEAGPDAWLSLMTLPTFWLNAVGSLSRMPGVAIGQEMATAVAQQQLAIFRSLSQMSPFGALLKGQIELADSMLSAMTGRRDE